MQRLGKVLHVTPSQNIIVKVCKKPEIGSTVINEELKITGKVFDVIGPVSSPYAVIKPMVDKPEKLIAKQLYMPLSKKNRSKKHE